MPRLFLIGSEPFFVQSSMQVRVPMTTILPRAKRVKHDDGGGLSGSRQPAGGPGPIGTAGHIPQSNGATVPGLGAGSSASPAEQLRAAAQGTRGAPAAEEDDDEDMEAASEVRMRLCSNCVLCSNSNVHHHVLNYIAAASSKPKPWRHPARSPSGVVYL